jgi:hypothetical protein
MAQRALIQWFLMPGHPLPSSGGHDVYLRVVRPYSSSKGDRGMDSLERDGRPGLSPNKEQGGSPQGGRGALALAEARPKQGGAA